MIAELEPVNSGALLKCIDISKHASEEITSDAFLLTIVELTTGNQILEGRIKNSDLHPKRLRNSFFASSLNGG